MKGIAAGRLNTKRAWAISVICMTFCAALFAKDCLANATLFNEAALRSALLLVLVGAAAIAKVWDSTDDSRPAEDRLRNSTTDHRRPTTRP
jgi:hypothetical protein